MLAAVTVLAACASAAIAAPAGDATWVGDFETGDFSQMQPDEHVNQAVAPQIVDDPAYVREGKYASKFTIEANPQDNGNYGARTERLPAIPEQREGDDLYFAWSVMLEDDFPTDTSWSVITQWHAKLNGSPPIAMGVANNEFQLEGGGSDGREGYTRSLGPAVTGEWVDWVFHIKFAHGPEGTIEVWRNGELILTNPALPSWGTMYDDEVTYVKFGYYRDFKLTEPGTLYFDSWKVGPSLTSVSTRAVGTGSTRPSVSTQSPTTVAPAATNKAPWRSTAQPRKPTRPSAGTSGLLADGRLTGDEARSVPMELVAEGRETAIWRDAQNRYYLNGWSWNPDDGPVTITMAAGDGLIGQRTVQPAPDNYFTAILAIPPTTSRPIRVTTKSSTHSEVLRFQPEVGGESVRGL